jgi:hypothetical protein
VPRLACAVLARVFAGCQPQFSHGRFGSYRFVQCPATPRASLFIEILTAKTRQEIAKWMEKELKKLGEAIYWSAQKFNIWEFAAA